jgi:mRNA interferase RelE/StbE
MFDIFKKLYRSRRNRQISKIIAGEIKQLPIGTLSIDEEDHIQHSLAEMHNSTLALVGGFKSSIEDILEGIWNPAVFTGDEFFELAKEPWFSDSVKKEPGWYIAFTPQFTNSIRNVDKKIQGRILGALTHLTDSPSTPDGDRIKPLTHNLRGLWRYRIGDHRLIYKPDESSKHIYLLAFKPRQSAYDT